ncbi:unnamed protein product, partial [Laminaria digitata]
LAHVAGWEPYNLHDLTHVSWVGSVLYRSCTIYHNDRLGSTMVDDLDHDLSDDVRAARAILRGTHRARPWREHARSIRLPVLDNRMLHLETRRLINDRTTKIATIHTSVKQYTWLNT